MFIRRAADRYDGEVAFMDHSFEQLVGELRKLNILDDTLVVFVSDHGEEFLDHGSTAHGHSLYRELLHAAMLLWNPRLIGSPRRLPGTVQVLDVYPTILDLLGIEPGGLVQGQSLKPLLEGRPLERKAPVVASRFAHPSARPDGLIAENRTGTFAIWDAQWKLLYRDRASAAGLPEVELYDHRNDRFERHDAAARNSEVVKRLRSELDRWMAAQTELAKALGPGGKSALDPQAIERLRTLGYIGGKAPE
jgi:arylsulfatase A-like enzyme